MYKLAVIVPKGSGGVLTVVNKVIRGLVNEKFDLQLFTMNSHRYVSYYINSFKMNLNNYDAVLYFGSITPLSSLLVRIPKALFIHGFVRHELFGILKSGHPKAKVGALIDLLRYEFSYVFESFLYICHSLTACETNKLEQHRFVLLPQFVLNDDVRESELLFNKKMDNIERMANRPRVRILIYTSLAKSPRLLTNKILFYIARKLDKLVKKYVDLIIVDPLNSASADQLDKLRIATLPFIPKQRFMKLLYEADLYVERCVDEEIGYTSIEAGLIGTPVAKLTRNEYMNRQDYTSSEVILGNSLSEFIEKIAEYINNIESYESVYATAFRKFIVHKRHWDYVKHDFINELRRLLTKQF